MTEYTSENIFMQNSTSGGVQWEQYIYLKKRKMVSTKFIALPLWSCYIKKHWMLDLAENIFFKTAFIIYAFLKHWT